MTAHGGAGPEPRRVPQALLALASTVTRRFDAVARWIARAGPGKWAIGLSLMALLARLPVIFARHEVTPGGDSEGYLVLRDELLSGRYQTLGDVRPPGYPVFIALLDVVPGRVEDAVVVAQHLLGTALVALIVLAAWSLMGRGPALVTGALTALSPLVIQIEEAILPDFLFGVLVLVGAGLLSRALVGERATPGALAGVGLAFAAATYFKPIALVLVLSAPLALIVVTKSWRRTVRGSVIVGLVVFVAVAPWMTRNLIVSGEFSMSTQVGTTLFNRAFEDDRLPVPRDVEGGALLVSYLDAHPDVRPSSGSFQALREAGYSAQEARDVQQRLAVTAFKRDLFAFARGTARSVGNSISDVGRPASSRSAAEDLARADSPFPMAPWEAAWKAIASLHGLWLVLSVNGFAMLLWFLARRRPPRAAAAALLATWAPIAIGTAVTHGGQVRYSVAIAALTWLLGCAGLAFIAALTGAAQRGRPNRRLVIGAVAIGMLTAAFVVPTIHARGSPVETAALDLNKGQLAPALVSGAVVRTVDGFAIHAGASGSADLRLPLEQSEGEGRGLRVWAGGAGLRTDVEVVRADGSRRALGRAAGWVGKGFDLSNEAAATSLRVRVVNPTGELVLFLDRVATIYAPPGSLITTSPLAISALLAVVALAVLLAVGALRLHWPLILALAAAGWRLSHEAAGFGLSALPPKLDGAWRQATGEADWLGLGTGLLTGTFGAFSGLEVQLLHVLTPVIGTGQAAAPAGMAVIAVAAILAVYAVANSVAGPWAAGGGVAAMLVSGFPAAAMLGGGVGTMVLTMSLLVAAVYAFWVSRTRSRAALVGVAAGIACLAEPLWLPGAAFLVLACGVAMAPPGLRLRVAVAAIAGLLAIAIPARAGVAAQHDGRPFADLTLRTTAATSREQASTAPGSKPERASETDLLSYVTQTSPSRALGDVLTGAADSVGSFAGAEGGPWRVLGIWLSLAGLVCVMLRPGPRITSLAAGLLMLPVLMMIGRGGTEPTFGAGLWPVLALGLGVLVAAAQLVLRRDAPAFVRGRVREARMGASGMSDSSDARSIS